MSLGERFGVFECQMMSILPTENADCDGSNSLPLVDVIALGALPVELNLADADFVAFEYPSAKTRQVVCALPGLV